MYYGLVRECGTTAAEFYAGLYFTTTKPQLAIMNCSLTSNLFSFFIRSYQLIC